MKKIIIHNGTNRTLSIITDETIFVVKSNEKIAIETVSKLICVKNKNDTRARIMVGLQYDSTSYASPVWGFRPIYVNTFDTYFDVADIHKFVTITEHCYIAGASGLAVFTVFKVNAANKDVQTLKFSGNDRKKYNLLRVFTILPLFLLATFLSTVVIFGIVTDFDIYVFLFSVLLSLFWWLLVIVYKKQKLFYLIENAPECVMKEAEEVSIVSKKDHFIKYKILTQKY